MDSGNLNTDSGLLNTHSGNCPKSVQLESESLFNFDQNDRSDWIRIGVQVGPEYAPAGPDILKLNRNQTVHRKVMILPLPSNIADCTGCSKYLPVVRVILMFG